MANYKLEKPKPANTVGGPKGGKTLAGKGRSKFDFVLALIGLETEIRAPNKVLFHCIDNYRISFNGPFSNSPQVLFQSQSKCNDLGHSFRVEIKFSGSTRFYVRVEAVQATSRPSAVKDASF